jgi:low affinity Fe/Cu permease
MPMRREPENSLTFTELARQASAALGTSTAFVIACASVVVWAVTGPLFGYSDTWQLVINTGTTVVTFLMVFLIQNTQNRDARALHLKLDELLRSLEAARNRLIDLENCSDEEIDRIERQFQALKRRGKRQNANSAGTSEAGAHGKVEN